MSEVHRSTQSTALTVSRSFTLATGHDAPGSPFNRAAALRAAEWLAGAYSLEDKLPIFDEDGRRIEASIIQACERRGWVEFLALHVLAPQWRIYRLTEAGRPIAMQCRALFAERRAAPVYSEKPIKTKNPDAGLIALGRRIEAETKRINTSSTLKTDRAVNAACRKLRAMEDNFVKMSPKTPAGVAAKLRWIMFHSSNGVGFDHCFADGRILKEAARLLPGMCGKGGAA